MIEMYFALLYYAFIMATHIETPNNLFQRSYKVGLIKDHKIAMQNTSETSAWFNNLIDLKTEA